MVVAPAQFLMAPPLQVIWLRAAQRILAEGTFEGDRSFLGPQLAQWNVKAICCWVGISLSFRLFARELPNCWDVLVVNSGCASKRLSPGSHLRLPQFLVCWLWRFLHFKIICAFVLVYACVGICMLALALSQLISISKWLSFLILVRAVGQLSCCGQQKKNSNKWNYACRVLKKFVFVVTLENNVELFDVERDVSAFICDRRVFVLGLPPHDQNHFVQHCQYFTT